MTDTTNFTSPQQEGFGVQSAGTLRVVSSERSMKTYIVTNSEIKNITLANGVAGVSFSLMSALWGYSFSMSTDLMFDPNPSPAAVMWSSAMHPLCVWVGIAFMIFGTAMVVWRHFMIDLIKRENSPDDRKRKNWFVRVWLAATE